MKVLILSLEEIHLLELARVLNMSDTIMLILNYCIVVLLIILVVML